MSPGFSVSTNSNAMRVEEVVVTGSPIGTTMGVMRLTATRR